MREPRYYLTASQAARLAELLRWYERTGRNLGEAEPRLDPPGDPIPMELGRLAQPVSSIGSTGGRIRPLRVSSTGGLVGDTGSTWHAYPLLGTGGSSGDRVAILRHWQSGRRYWLHACRHFLFELKDDLAGGGSADAHVRDPLTLARTTQLLVVTDDIGDRYGTGADRMQPGSHGAHGKAIQFPGSTAKYIYDLECYFPSNTTTTTTSTTPEPTTTEEPTTSTTEGPTTSTTEGPTTSTTEGPTTSTTEGPTTSTTEGPSTTTTGEPSTTTTPDCGEYGCDWECQDGGWWFLVGDYCINGCWCDEPPIEDCTYTGKIQATGCHL